MRGIGFYLFVLCAVPAATVPAQVRAQSAGPALKVTPSLSRVSIAGGSDTRCATPSKVTLSITATGFKNDAAPSVMVTGGRVTVEDGVANWDLGGVPPGTYMAMVDAKNDQGESASGMTTVEVANC